MQKWKILVVSQHCGLDGTVVLIAVWICCKALFYSESYSHLAVFHAIHWRLEYYSQWWTILSLGPQDALFLVLGCVRCNKLSFIFKGKILPRPLGLSNFPMQLILILHGFYFRLHGWCQQAVFSPSLLGLRSNPGAVLQIVFNSLLQMTWLCSRILRIYATRACEKFHTTCVFPPQIMCNNFKFETVKDLRHYF